MSKPLPQLPSRPSPALDLDPRTYDRALACVHCGLCLPACPTYTTTWHEGDSPRGRIQIIKHLADGSLQLTDDLRRHLDTCLDCRACETACPSGVVYHELIEEARTKLAPASREHHKLLGTKGRLLRLFFFHIMTRPARLRWALLPARLLQRVGIYEPLRRIGAMKLLPGPLAKLEAMLPARGTLLPSPPPELTPAHTTKKLRVAYFHTCVGSVMFDALNARAVQLLARLGAEVVTPRAQACCGAIHHHNADEHSAQDLARRNIDALLATDPDVIVASVAGCGAQLREYAHLLRDDPAYRDRAALLVSKTRDVSEVLLDLGLPPAAELHPLNLTVTYHDACHLAHAQRVTAPPRKLLAQLPGLKLVALRESEICCGAAGTYNLTEPEMASDLADRKLAHASATGAGIVVSANAGCTLHLAATIKQKRLPLRLLHPVDLVHAAVFNTPLDPLP